MINEILLKCLKNNPKKTAVIYKNKSFTYKELNNMVLLKKCNRLNFLPNDKFKALILLLSSFVNRKTYISVNKDFKKINKNYRDIKGDFDNICYITMTTGSTGKPKYVPISYDNVENFVKWIKKIIPNNCKRILNTASFCFDLSVCDIFYSMFFGKTIILLPEEYKENLKLLFKYIYKTKPDLIVLTNTFASMLLLDPSFNKENVNIKCFLFCGEVLDKNIVKKLNSRFDNTVIINSYGPSEATCAVSAVTVTNEMLDSKKSIPIGDINNTAVDIKIINNEIILTGKSVFNGYLNSEKKINSYNTKDLGYIENNLLYFNGRTDSQIKMHGYRINLLYIESIINNYYNIESIIVPVIKNEAVAHLICYYKNDIEIDFKNSIIKILPKYMIPKKYIKVLEFPVNKNGKIDRKEIAKWTQKN